MTILAHLIRLIIVILRDTTRAANSSLVAAQAIITAIKLVGNCRNFIFILRCSIPGNPGPNNVALKTMLLGNRGRRIKQVAALANFIRPIGVVSRKLCSPSPRCMTGPTIFSPL